MRNEKADSYLREWKRNEQCAEAMLPLVGKLYREHGVIITCYGNCLLYTSPSPRDKRQSRMPSSA